MSNSGVTIRITNSSIKGKSELLTGVTIRGKSEIIISELSLDDEAKVLSELNIDEFSSKLGDVIPTLDPSSKEFQELVKLHNQIKSGHNDRRKAIKDHIVNFVEGVAINIISNMVG